MKELRSGIKLVDEIEGYGQTIENKDTFDGILKFYRKQGDPIIFTTVVRESVPYLIKDDSGKTIFAHTEPTYEKSNIVFERNSCLARECDFLPGVYYSILGMKEYGYRITLIPPHLYAHSMHEVMNIPKESVVRFECYLQRVIKNV
jgi:hypothetical protein